MIGARIVETFAIGNDDAEERAQIEELMPVAVVAGKPRSVEADDKAGIAQTDLGDQLLEAHPLDGAGSGFAKVFVDDMDPFMRPAESDGTIDEAVLQLRAFLMMPHLVHGRLADVNISELAAMRGGHTFVRPIRRSQHARAPRAARVLVASASVGEQGSVRSAFAFPPTS